MTDYSFARCSDPVLLRDLAANVARERATLAVTLAQIAEVDARRIYLPAGHPSLFSFCVQGLGFSEEAAYKRIHAARVARRFPAIFPALAEGRLHLSGVVLLAPRLTEANAGELLAAAAGRSRAEIERLLAERFPRPDLPERAEAMLPPAALQLAPEPDAADEHAPGRVEATSSEHAPGRVGRVAARSPGRFALQFMVGQDAYDKLQYARDLLGHRAPAGDIATVFEAALDALIARLEKRKLGSTERPRSGRHHNARGRHVPAHVRRAVWARDGGQCTFVSETGRRCCSRTRLEFDHIEPVARCGESTVANLRLRCRAHNQLAAEQAFGAGFMEEKRAEARRHAEERRAGRAAQRIATRACAGAVAELKPDPDTEAARARAAAVAEVIPWLRSLGLRADEARRAADHCQGLANAPLETRLRHALACFGGPGRKVPVSMLQAT